MPSSWKTDEYLEHFKYMYLSETFDHARNFNDCIELIQTLPEVTFETVVALIEKGNHHRSDCVISILALMDDIEAIEFLIDLFELDRSRRQWIGFMLLDLHHEVIKVAFSRLVFANFNDWIKGVVILRGLRQYKDDALIDVYKQIAEDNTQSEDIRHDAIMGLEDYPSQATFNYLRQFLSNSMPEVRGRASIILAKIDSAQALPLVLYAISNADDDDLAMPLYVDALGEISDDEATTQLIQFLDHPNNEVSSNAFWVLGKRRDNLLFIQALLDRAKHNPTYIDLEYLGDMKVEEARPILTSALTHEDEYIRIGAVMGLAKFADDNAINKLFAVLENDTSTDVRWTCAYELARISDELAVKALVPLLDDDSWTATDPIARLAVKNLVRIDSTELVEPMLKLLDSEDTILRQYAGCFLYSSDEEQKKIGLSVVKAEYEKGKLMIESARWILKKHGIDLGY